MYRTFLIFAFLGLCSCTSSSPPITDSPGFIWPVHGGKITQGFKTSSNRHDGLDISGQRKAPVYASAGGRVLYTGKGFNGYGNLIIIEHGSDKWATFYAHLNRIQVKEGQRVFKGQKIGLMGKTGRATGVHLHFEVRYNLRPINPLNFLTAGPMLTRR